MARPRHSYTLDVSIVGKQIDPATSRPKVSPFPGKFPKAEGANLDRALAEARRIVSDTGYEIRALNVAEQATKGRTMTGTIRVIVREFNQSRLHRPRSMRALRKGLPAKAAK